jgi:hypothetical protein
LLPIIKANIQAEAFVMTDSASWYKSLGDTFASHGSVNHVEYEYVRREFFPDADNKVQVRKVHTNTVEGFYSIFKRGMRLLPALQREAPAPLSC